MKLFVIKSYNSFAFLAAVSGVLHQSISERVLTGKNRSSVYSKRRHYSLTCEPAFSLPLPKHRENSEEKKDCDLQKESEGSACKIVNYECFI